MKPENEAELKSLLIKHYSNLCSMKSEKLIEKMKQVDWLEKERYRLKVQYAIGCFSLGFVLACVVIVVVMCFIARFNTIKYSLMVIAFSMIASVFIFNNIVQKKNIFKILEIIAKD